MRYPRKFKNGRRARARARQRIKVSPAALALVWLLLALPVSALTPSDQSAVDEGMVSFETALEILWAGKGGEGSAVDFLDQAESAFLRIDDSAERAYRLSRVSLYRGRLALAVATKREALAYLETSMNLAEEALSYREFSEAYRVWSDAGSSFMVTKGLGAIIKLAPQVAEWSEKAVELDPTNATAIIISAQGKINAPKSAGGDPEGAREMLDQLMRRNDLSRIDEFFGAVSLAQVNLKLKDRDTATRWCRLASSIYPDNPMAEDCRKKLKL